MNIYIYSDENEEIDILQVVACTSLTLLGKITYQVLVSAQSSITALISIINHQSVCLHTCSRSEITLKNSDVYVYLYVT